MSVPDFRRRSVFVGLVIFLVFGGCVPSPAALTSQLLGRWQRVGESSLTEPYVFAEYVEFRPGGQLVELLWDPGPQQAWTINVSRYTVSSGGRVEFSGDCWRGWDRYLCTHTYAVSQAGTSLSIIDEQDRHKTVQYRRIADIDPEPPPTLAPPFPSPTPAPTVGVTATPQAAPELAEAVEAWQLLNTQGDRVWPGWGKTQPPLLIRQGESDLLIGHPAPPPEFSRLPDLSVAGQPVHRYTGHLVPVPAATAWEVGGVWSVAVPTRAEFQQAIDAQLGKGVVQLDAANYIRAIVHEAFHAYAMIIIHGQVPNFGADVDDAELIQRLSALPDLNQQHDAEGQALVKALQATDDQIARKAAADFLKLRQVRRAGGDKQSAAYEQTTEWVEGLARYAEVAVMKRAGHAVDQSADTAIHYPAAAEVWQQFLDQLANPAASPGGFRGRYYLLGAGQAFLLDRLQPGWKTDVLAKKQSLETLLEQALR